MFEKHQHLLSGCPEEYAKEMFYEGKECKRCGNTLRYKKGYFCVQCARNHSRKQYAKKVAEVDAVSKSKPNEVEEASKVVIKLLTKKYTSAQSLHAAMRKKGFDKQVTLAALKELGAEKEKIGGTHYYKPIEHDESARETQSLVAEIFNDFGKVSPVEHKSHERVVIEKLNFIASEMISINSKAHEVLCELRRPNIFQRAWIRVEELFTK